MSNKTSKYFKYLLDIICFIIMVAIMTSCANNKHDNTSTYTDTDNATAPTNQQQNINPQTGEPQNPEPGHKYLNGKDLTNNKQICTMCNGTGKRNGNKCQGCQGYGYLLVYE